MIDDDEMTIDDDDHACAAAVAHGPGEALVMEEVEVAPPARMEVRLKVLFTSICHTDLSAWKGEVYIFLHIYIHIQIHI